MKKNILLGIILITFSFLFIGNVKGDEKLPDIDSDLFNNSESDANGNSSNKSPKEITEETVDEIKSGEWGDTSPDNYFKGTDGSIGDKLGCIYKGDGGSLLLTCIHYKNDAVSCVASSQGSVKIKWLGSLRSDVMHKKACPKGVGMSGSRGGDADGGSSARGIPTTAFFGKSNGKAYNEYLNCLKSSSSCWWFKFDSSFACNPSEEGCNEKFNSVTTERTIASSQSKNKFIAKFKKDRDYNTKEVKVESGCGLFSDEATRYIKIALTYIVVAGFILTIVLGMTDFIKAIIGSEDKGITNAWKRFLKRVVSLAILLILPALVAFLLVSLDLKGVNEGSIFCGVVDTK